jgi:general secretion pathway protein H
MVIAMPTIKNVTGMQARTDVSKLASNIRAARGHAAVSGETCRMVFNIAKSGSSYTLECTKAATTIAKETSRNGVRDVLDPLNDHRTGETVEQQKARDALKAKAAFTPSKALPTQVFKGSAQLYSVWTPHQPEAYTGGQAMLYFFPSGTVEPANIIVQQDSDTFYTVQVTGLAGEVKVLGDKVALPQQSSDDDW